VRIDEQLFREFNERARGMALFAEGRIIYEMMETVWPSAAQDESLPGHLREWAEIWTAAPKVLVSNSRTTAGHNTRVVGGADAITELAAIRDETDGTIAVGGATLATQLLRNGLLDELLLYTHPAILGSGRPLFDEVGEPLECDLLEHATFESGVALNRYQIRGQRTE
jgi:dihydrofolate reductase